MMTDVLVHFVLEGLGDLGLGCLLLLCKHDHLPRPWMNKVVHARAYQFTLIVLFNLLTSYLMVRAVG